MQHKNTMDIKMLKKIIIMLNVAYIVLSYLYIPCWEQKL